MLVFFNFSHDTRTACRRFFVWPGLLLALFAPKNVSAFPTIFSQPVSVSVSYAQNAAMYTNVSFIVRATDAATNQDGTFLQPSFQWRHNGAPFTGIAGIDAPFGITNGANASHGGTVYYSTLTLSDANAIPGEGGIYSVVVFDADGAVDTANASLTFTNFPAAPATDNFAARGTLGGQYSFAGTFVANNIGATKEPGEPNHAGISGGTSVWLKWFAPFTGLATFNLTGSDFDTTIGIYTNGNPSAPSVGNLIFVAGDDDLGGYFGSLARFNTISNQEYEIAIDGFYGATGHVMLNWANNSGGGVISASAQPHNVVVTNNANLTLTVDFGFTNNFFVWYFNGVEVTQTVNSLTIPNVTAANVGLYTVSSGRTLLFSQPIEVQIADDGNTNSIAERKFRLATDPNSGLQSNFHIHPNAVPVSGFTGTHIWNTYGAESEPGEPNHCGKAGGAPYWFSYKSPADGNLTVDANTPTFTNVLAVYTGPGDSFATLADVDCASTNAGTGNEEVNFQVANGTVYWIVVDGLNGAVGPVTLSYNLASPPVLPVIKTQPQSQTVSQGGNVTLTVGAIGNPPPAYQWRTNTVKFQGQTNAGFTVANFQSANQGNYDVILTNIAGSVTSSVAALYLNSPLRFGNFGINATSGFTAALLGAANTNYIIQTSTNLAKTNWVSIATNNSPFGVISITDTNSKNFPGRYYRAMPQ